MTTAIAQRSLDADVLARALGNWRTAGLSGPTYEGLSDALRLLVVDGRVPVGARLPSERSLAASLRVSRTTVTAAYARLGEDGYLHARRGARSLTALPTPSVSGADGPATTSRVSLAVAALAAPPTAMGTAFAEACARLPAHLDGAGHELLGVDALRAAVADRYCRRGLPTAPEQIMITSGAQQAITLALIAFTETGDRVLVEQPTYHGALSAIATAGARAVPVAMTDTGWDLDGVASALRQLAPALAYVVPDNHNPTGFTLPADGRARLARLISDTRTRTVVDETIVDMWLDDGDDAHRPPPLAALMTRRHDLVVTVGSMSKTFWGGLRIGWVRAETSTIAALAALRPAVDLGTAVVDQLAAVWLLHHGEEVLAERRALLRSRREFLRQLLADRLPTWEPGVGAGGMSLWVRLPAPMSTALSAAASRLGLDLPAGPRFGVDGTLERFVRVPYALPESQLVAAVDVMVRAWHVVTGSGGPDATSVVV